MEAASIEIGVLRGCDVAPISWDNASSDDGDLRVDGDEPAHGELHEAVELGEDHLLRRASSSAHERAPDQPMGAILSKLTSHDT